ncbi:MAG: zinc ribbon domain-containing protein [Deltaproteobacteria bacterium]|nr:zinc ribbon domain-containing protein [Deltaproteobacteria bacterium]
MPIYEYECTKCGHKFEELIFSRTDVKPECPKCGAKHTKRLISASSFSTSGLSSGSTACSSPAGSRFS